MICRKTKSNGVETMVCQRLLHLAAMLVFLKGTPAWLLHTFLFKTISFLLIHIFVVKCCHALKFFSIV